MEHVYDPLRNVLFEIGPITIYLYSFMIMLGVLTALYLGIKEGKRIGLNPDNIIDGLLIILPLAIVGARLYYVIFQWDMYRNDLMRIFRLSEGGLAIHGGFIVAIIAALIFTRIKRMDTFKVFDIMAPGFLIGQAFGRWGNFFNQEAHGGVIGGLNNAGQVSLSLDEQRAFLSETLHLPEFIVNNMYLRGDSGLNYYHPTFLYESLWNLLGVGIILILRRTKFVRSGDMLGFYLIWYSVGRFFIEGMRTDSLYIGDSGLRTAQVISILMIVGGATFIALNHAVFKRKHYTKILEENSVQ